MAPGSFLSTSQPYRVFPLPSRHRRDQLQYIACRDCTASTRTPHQWLDTHFQPTHRNIPPKRQIVLARCSPPVRKAVPIVSCGGAIILTMLLHSQPPRSRQITSAACASASSQLKGTQSTFAPAQPSPSPRSLLDLVVAHPRSLSPSRRLCICLVCSPCWCAAAPPHPTYTVPSPSPSPSHPIHPNHIPSCPVLSYPPLPLAFPLAWPPFAAKV